MRLFLGTSRKMNRGYVRGAISGIPRKKCLPTAGEILRKAFELKKNSENFVSRKELAELFEVSPTSIDAWVERGCPVVSRKGKGHRSAYDIAEIVRWAVRTHYGLMCG